jgi:hypothetical protein
MKTPPDPKDRDGAETVGAVVEDSTRPARFGDLEHAGLAYLAGGKRTTWDAVDALGTTNLRNIVSDLGARGVTVQREPFTFINRRGKKIRALRYWIEPGEASRVLQEAGRGS